MRVLIAPTAFAGTLTAAQAAEALAEGWRRAAPADELDLCPLAGAGPGHLDAVQAARGGRLLPVTVAGPLPGTPEGPATVLLVEGDGQVPTAHLETAQATGRHLLPAGTAVDADLLGRTTSAGVGALLVAARAAGARRVVAAVGDGVVLDGGAGMLAAVAGSADPPALAALRRDWAEVELVVATDADGPLLGIRGAARARPELDAGAAGGIDAALTGWATAVLAATGAPERTVAHPGAGAGGGVGFGLLLLGGRRVAAVDAVAAAVGLERRITAADLVVTGEGSLGWRSLGGGVVHGVAARALAAGVPVVAVAGQVEVGRRELLTVGVESAYPVARTPAEVAASLADPAGRLADRAARVARTWSRAG